MIKSCQNVIITKSQRFESYFSKANVRSPILAKAHVWESYFSNFLYVDSLSKPYLSFRLVSSAWVGKQLYAGEGKSAHSPDVNKSIFHQAFLTFELAFCLTSFVNRAQLNEHKLTSSSWMLSPTFNGLCMLPAS